MVPERLQKIFFFKLKLTDRRGRKYNHSIVIRPYIIDKGTTHMGLIEYYTVRFGGAFRVYYYHSEDIVFERGSRGIHINPRRRIAVGSDALMAYHNLKKAAYEEVLRGLVEILDPEKIEYRNAGRIYGDPNNRRDIFLSRNINIQGFSNTRIHRLPFPFDVFYKRRKFAVIFEDSLYNDLTPIPVKKTIVRPLRFDLTEDERRLIENARKRR